MPLLIIILLLLGSLNYAPLLSSSYSLAEERPAGLTSPEPIVWPQPPEKARIKFLYTFKDRKDLGFRISLYKKLMGFILGKNSEGMIRPYSIAVETNLIAVADPGGRALLLFDKKRKKFRRITKAGNVAFLSPVGVSIGQDEIYLSDSLLKKVFVLDKTGKHIFTINGLDRPPGLVFDKNKMRLYVADTLGSRIYVIDKQGKKLFSFGKRGRDKGEFNYPTHLFLTANTLYVNDTMNFRIQAFDLEGNYLFSFGKHGDGSGDFAQPKGVGVDSEGHIYVVDSLSDRVQIFDRQGRLLLAFGNQGNRAGEFWLPSGLFISQDSIYVADSYNKRVQVFQFLGGEQK